MQTQHEGDKACDPNERSCQVSRRLPGLLACIAVRRRRTRLHRRSRWPRSVNRVRWAHSPLLYVLSFPVSSRSSHLLCPFVVVQTPMYVWESNCLMCSGTGSITSYGSRRRSTRRTTSVCPGCHGIGAHTEFPAGKSSPQRCIFHHRTTPHIMF